MRRRACVLVVVARVCFAGAASTQEDEVQIRLTTPLSSYSPAGTPFSARVIGPVLPGDPALARGTAVHGAVRVSKKVGLGFRRERARLELSFERCEAASGEIRPCQLELIGVDNARESVANGNAIVGILAASHPHGWFNGVWFRPAPSLMRRALFGLTGTAGAVQSRLIPNPLGAGIVIASKTVVLGMPDPEIRLPAGTDLIVRVRTDGQERQSTEALPQAASFSSLAEAPSAVVRSNGTPVRDLVNLAFAGSKEEIATAFESAGWSPADARTARTVARMYGAFAAMKTYDTAPVSPLFYDGRLPELVFQKSFNSIAKRHHIRIWSAPGSDSPMFVAAATHDVALALHWRKLRPTHEVDPEIDKERTKVINDLMDAGCVENVESVPRPELAISQRGARRTVTDGQLHVIALKACSTPMPQRVDDEQPKTGFASTAIRRTVLETRYHFTRGNVVYWAYRGVRAGVQATRTLVAHREHDKPDVVAGIKRPRGEQITTMHPQEQR